MSERTAAADAATPDPELASLSYEQARDELVDAVRRLESGGLPLEESLALWERGERLAQHCQAWLDGARERLAARRPTNLDVETVSDDGNEAADGE